MRAAIRRCAAALALAAFALVGIPADGRAAGAGAAVEVAVELPLSGEEASYGTAVMEGIQLAIEEANAGDGPRIALKTYDDQGSDEVARRLAERIVASPAALVLGPAFSTNSLAAGPVYAAAGLASLATTCTADSITRNATTFRVLFKNSDQGELLALYLARVLGLRSADVIVVDNGYGHTLQEGFARAAQRLGITPRYLTFATPEQADQAARDVIADPAHPPVVLLTLDADAARILLTLRRGGVTGPFLGGDALGDEVLSRRFADEPEERRRPGYFTDGLLGISPMILDSANAEVLDFATRFRARFGHDPVWMSATGYDSGRLAAATIRAIVAGPHPPNDAAALRAAALAYLVSLNDPAQAVPGMLGPFWFDTERGRPLAIRIGRFSRNRFESAPLQVVPVSTPDPAELASGAVFETAPGRYARLQRVVYTGVYINEIPRVDLAQASFGADFYLWLRFARDAGPEAPDPTDLTFPGMLSGSFDRARPSEQGEMRDGTVYRLWRVSGTFRNDFDLHRFPFDAQRLSLSFFNARAAADRIVYVVDRRTAGRPARPAAPAAGSASAAEPSHPSLGVAAGAAFRNLTQWRPLGAVEARENLVTDSALGDPRRAGVESYRELSGFKVTVEVERRALATLAKTLLPLLLMTLIMFASLFFPHALVKEKITVAITGALSGAVLLTSINAQLGGIGYTVAVEYAFYVFFALSTLCIVSVLLAERQRVAGRAVGAARIDRVTRLVFLLGVAVVAAGATGLYAGWLG
jgi:ABC-type branched-subunit amino acid transport system substrate-binding protein